MFLPASDESIWIGVMRIVVHVSGSRSIKDKRRVVAKVRDRLRACSDLSVAEVGHLDHRTRTVIAVCQISNDPKFIRSNLDRRIGEIERWVGGAIESHHLEVFRFNDHFTARSF